MIGRYILGPQVLHHQNAKTLGAGGEIQLTDALAKQIGSAPFHGLRFSGERFDCGSKLGFLQANLAFGMSNTDLAPDLKAWMQERLK